jgi:hypothetical protein
MCAGGAGRLAEVLGAEPGRGKKGRIERRQPGGENMQPKYRRPAPGHVVSRALQLLNISQVAALNRIGRVTSAHVSQWVTGKRHIPKWAAKILADDMRAKAAELTAGAAELEAAATDGWRGRNNGAHALMAWRLHRLAQKEKAGD